MRRRVEDTNDEDEESEEEEDVSNTIMERIAPHLEATKILLLTRLNLYTSEDENQFIVSLYAQNQSDETQSDDAVNDRIFDEEMKLFCKYWKEETAMRIKSGMIRKQDQEEISISNFINDEEISDHDRKIASLVQEIKNYDKLGEKQKKDIQMLSSLVERREQMLDIQRKQHIQELMIYREAPVKPTKLVFGSGLNSANSVVNQNRIELVEAISKIHEGISKKIKQSISLASRLKALANTIDSDPNLLNTSKRKELDMELKLIEKEGQNLINIDRNCESCVSYQDQISRLERELANERNLSKLKDQLKAANTKATAPVQHEQIIQDYVRGTREIDKKKHQGIVFKLQDRISKLSTMLATKTKELDLKTKEYEEMNSQQQKSRAKFQFLTTEIQRLVMERDLEASRHSSLLIRYQRAAMMKEDVLARLRLLNKQCNQQSKVIQGLKKENSKPRDIMERSSQTDPIFMSTEPFNNSNNPPISSQVDEGNGSEQTDDIEDPIDVSETTEGTGEQSTEETTEETNEDQVGDEQNTEEDPPLDTEDNDTSEGTLETSNEDSSEKDKTERKNSLIRKKLKDNLGSIDKKIPPRLTGQGRNRSYSDSQTLGLRRSHPLTRSKEFKLRFEQEKNANKRSTEMKKSDKGVADKSETGEEIPVMEDLTHSKDSVLIEFRSDEGENKVNTSDSLFVEEHPKIDISVEFTSGDEDTEDGQSVISDNRSSEQRERDLLEVEKELNQALSSGKHLEDESVSYSNSINRSTDFSDDGVVTGDVENKTISETQSSFNNDLNKSDSSGSKDDMKSTNTVIVAPTTSFSDRHRFASPLRNKSQGSQTEEDPLSRSLSRFLLKTGSERVGSLSSKEVLVGRSLEHIHGIMGLVGESLGVKRRSVSDQKELNVTVDASQDSTNLGNSRSLSINISRRRSLTPNLLHKVNQIQNNLAELDQIQQLFEVSKSNIVGTINNDAPSVEEIDTSKKEVQQDVVTDQPATNKIEDKEVELQLLYIKKMEVLGRLEERTRQMYEKVAKKRVEIMQESVEKWERYLSATGALSQTHPVEKEMIIAQYEEQALDSEEDAPKSKSPPRQRKAFKPMSSPYSDYYESVVGNTKGRDYSPERLSDSLVCSPAVTEEAPIRQRSQSRLVPDRSSSRILFSNDDHSELLNETTRIMLAGLPEINLSRPSTSQSGDIITETPVFKLRGKKYLDLTKRKDGTRTKKKRKTFVVDRPKPNLMQALPSVTATHIETFGDQYKPARRFKIDMKNNLSSLTTEFRSQSVPLENRSSSWNHIHDSMI